MIVHQIRHKPWRREKEHCPDDRFLTSQEAVNKHLWLCNEAVFFPGDTPSVTAKVIKTTEIDIEPSEFVPNARPWKPEFCQAVTAACMCGRPPPLQSLGYPKTTTTVILNGEPRNLAWKLARLDDSYAGFNGVANHYTWQVVRA